MPPVSESGVQRLAAEIDGLRRENEALLRELENAYAQLTAVLQVSQDETRIAYSELQEKLVVQEKKLVELSFLSSVGESLFAESDLPRLRRLVLEKMCLLVPVDLAHLQLADAPSTATQRERDLVREVAVDPELQAALAEVAERLDADGVDARVVPDLDAHPDARALRLRPDARAAAVVPLGDAGRRLGLLVLNSRLRSNFRADQEPLLGAFGHQAASALVHALHLGWHRERLLAVRRAHALTIAAVVGPDEPGVGAALETEMRQDLVRWLAQADRSWAPPRPEPSEDA